MKEYECKYPEKIVVIDSKENLRQGGARNLGIRAATAEYIGFVDSDDWIAPNMFEQLYKKTIETNSDITSCNCFRAKSANEYVPFMVRDLTSITGELNARKHEKILSDGASPGVWSKIYRKSMITDNNIWFPEHLFYEDNYWVPLLFLYAKNYHHLDECYYYYFINPNSTVVSRESIHHFDRLTIEVMKLEEFKRRGFYDQYRDAIELSFINLYYVNSLYLAFSRFERPPFDKVFEMRKYIKENFPEYRKSEYFEKISDFGRIITGLNDISPYKAYEWYKSNC